MKNQDLQYKVVLKKNTELAAKLSWYRRENQELRRKNDDLNTWVENLSEVFASISSAWQQVGLIEDSLQILLKKKTDVKDQKVIRKFMSQFNAFASIVSNLGDKIRNGEHSDQTALDAKERLSSFVKNYQIFLRELVDNFFRFNDEYSQLLNEMKNKPEIQAFTRQMMNKELENRQKIKEFEGFIQSFNEKYKVFESFNQHTLLNGVIKQKEEEIATLKSTIYQFERRFKAMFDYNSASIDLQLEEAPQNLECFCGGVQLQYMKEKWEEHLKQMEKKEEAERNEAESDEERKVGQDKYNLLEEEKQSLIKRNSILLEQINKLRLQMKLTDENVLKSSIYANLKEQCQYVLDYVADLLMKIKKNEEYLSQIERIREEEVRILKQKCETTTQKDNSSSIQNPQLSKNILQSFKTQTSSLMTQLIRSYRELSEKSLKPQNSASKNRQLISELKKDNDDLQKKISEYQSKQLGKVQNLEFRHDKFKTIEVKFGPLVKEKFPDLMSLWEQFIGYVKTRDKKIKDLQSIVRKREKQVSQKSKIEQIMQANLKQTESVFLLNKSKLQKTEQFITKFEKELLRLADENFHLKSQSEQQKNLLSIKLKTQTEIKNKLEIKVGFISQIEEQINNIRENEKQLQKNYEKWMSEQKQQNQNLLKDLEETKTNVKLQNQELAEKDKLISKLLTEKQSLKSEIRELKDKLNSVKDKSEQSLMKMELEEYRNKIMCICTGDREKTIVLKTCPHMWCKKCIESTTSNRNRACPKCRTKFTKSDIHEIQWN